MDSLKAIFAIGFFLVNTVFWCLVLYVFALLRFVIPFRKGRDWASGMMVKVAEAWISGNKLNMDSQHVQIEVRGISALRPDRSYFVVANHQSWTDIVVLQYVFNRKIPFLRFFLKKELKYVPLLGLAWKALDFPFMERHSKEYLRKYPEKKGTDLETTRRICENFKGKHISILNFLEGTRYSAEKSARLQSEFRQLLPPKAGGFSFVLGAMGEQFESLLDVTLFYPEKPVTLWRLFSGRIKHVIVDVKAIAIPQEFCSTAALEDREQRAKSQSWVKNLWRQKDDLLLSLESAENSKIQSM